MTTINAQRVCLDLWLSDTINEPNLIETVLLIHQTKHSNGGSRNSQRATLNAIPKCNKKKNSLKVQFETPREDTNRFSVEARQPKTLLQRS